MLVISIGYSGCALCGAHSNDLSAITFWEANLNKTIYPFVISAVLLACFAAQAQTPQSVALPAQDNVHDLILQRDARAPQGAVFRRDQSKNNGINVSAQNYYTPDNASKRLPSIGAAHGRIIQPLM